jgi:hypothetical protein
MLGLVGLVLGGYISVILTLLFVKLKKGISVVESLEQTISEKFKDKREIINEMSILEAKKHYIRLKAEILGLVKEASPILTKCINDAIAGNKGSSTYREGRF